MQLPSLLPPQNFFVRLFGQPRDSLCCGLRFIHVLFGIASAMLVHFALVLMEIKLIHTVSPDFERFNVSCLVFHGFLP